jgi:hypothetical protein
VSHILSPVILVAALSVAGCASQIAPGAESSGSTLDVFVQNEVPGAATLKGSFVYAYADAKCTQRTEIAKKIMMKDQDQHGTVKIPAGKPFTASVQTGWTRFGAGGNDFCSVTATFTPSPNSSYRALLKLDGSARKCELQIADQNNREVAYQSPIYSCDQTMGTTRNGEAGFRSVTVKVINY